MRLKIDLKQLEDLLAVLEDRNVVEFEYQEGESLVRLRRGKDTKEGAWAAEEGEGTATQTAVTASPTFAAPPAAQAPAVDPHVAYVTAPFVGTFYRAPSPEAPPFVGVGATVKEGQALCIVEAMKLMNEIDAEFPCTILEILVENAHSVEYGQKLFKVRRA